MSTPVQPVVIKGPAIVIRDSYSFYVRGDITVRRARPTFNVMTDMHGQIDVRSAGQVVTELSFTPAGEIESLAKYFPHGPTNLVTACAVGNSVFTGSAVPTVIHTKAGQTITYHRTGVTQMPALSLSPRKTLFGAMTITALGKPATAMTDAAFQKTIGSSAFSDTGFDETKVVTDIYRAALGARSAPYNAMGARDGFELIPSLEFADSEDDAWGLVDKHISAVSWRCRFAPNNLTEAELDVLLAAQDTDALLVGQSVGRGPSSVAEDLVISSDVLTATLHKCGLVSTENGFGVAVDRNGNIEFATRMSFTTGAPNPLVTLTIN